MATETKNGKRAKSTSPETLLKDIRRNTKRIFSSEQKVLIVMEGIRGEISVAELCRKYGISDTTYYKWSKEFIEAGKSRLEGDILREATNYEVQELRSQNQGLKMALAELVLRYDIVKKLETLRISSQHQKYMRYTAEEKEEIIRAVKSSEISISESLRYLGIPKRSFYNWYHKYSVGGLEALRSKPTRSPHTWNRIPDTIRELTLEHPEITARELSIKLLEESGVFISESSYYRILRAAGLLKRIEHDFVWVANEYKYKTQFPNEMWQTDFTYFKVKGVGWYYLSTVLDYYSRYIIHWELCSSMSAQDVARSIDQAMLKVGLTYKNAPKFLSDIGNLRQIDVYLGKQEQILKIREQLKRDSLNQRYQARVDALKK